MEKAQKLAGWAIPTHPTAGLHRYLRCNCWLRKPVLVQGPDHFDEFQGVGWLEKVSVGAKLAGLLHVFRA
jgi:hypothetical protein